MGLDYYRILHLPRCATIADIKKAYRKLSLKYHPDKNPGDQNAADIFLEIAEAYDVLTDSKRKAVYDQFGEEILKRGLTDAVGKWDVSFSLGYKFHGNADKVFSDFFGGDNPFAEFFDLARSNCNQRCRKGHAGQTQGQDPPIEAFLDLTLEEVFHGCIKKMPVCKRVMDEDGITSSVRDKPLTISVGRGWLPGTRIIFSNEGDQSSNNIPADIVYTVRDKPHPRFRREGTSLIHLARVSLAQALLGCLLSIQTLDDRILHIPVTDIVCPGYTMIIKGEGMPLVCAPCNRGDLIIEFDIEFPCYLTPEKKHLIQKALLS
ncbi:unnamed protein product [Candidula unifasciata]|uniref:J domain-containing protein n=1 Tax=Candidula unifasciata TaxID=100452 RepID=A0A8S3YT74_9EUPU|nr:unnamed protein product [Candidula unifasciata]